MSVAGAASENPVNSMLAAMYAGDAALLERLVPRKELRKHSDLVRLFTGQVDERPLALDVPWFFDDAPNAAAVDNQSDGEDDEDDGDEEGRVESGSGESDGSIVFGGDDNDDDDEANDADGDSDDGQVEGGHLDEDDARFTTRSSSTRKRKQPLSDFQMERTAGSTKKVAFTAAAAATATGSRTTPPPSPSSHSSAFSKERRSSSIRQAPPISMRTLTNNGRHHRPLRPGPATAETKRNPPIAGIDNLALAAASAPPPPPPPPVTTIRKTNDAKRKANAPPLASVAPPAPAQRPRQSKPGVTTRKPAANLPTTRPVSAQNKPRQADADKEDDTYSFSQFF
jgi:hypothetical protein